MSDHTQRLLTETEAADILRLTSSRVLRLARGGQLPAVKLPGNEFRFVESDLWKWVDGHRTEAAR